MSCISPLSELNRNSLPSAGGKGANLGELIAAGFPVPPGFVLTTEAYDVFVSEYDLKDQIVALASQIADGDAQSGEEAAAAIKSLFLAADVPQAVSDALLDAYARLTAEGVTAVAVRSSATAEDLPAASFAGQQDTFLNVRGEEALLDAVRRCWASLWTARAIAYRARQGIAPQEVSLAVVVQAMVEAEVSGVLFTANPRSGARDELLVEATFGLGEALVSGLVTPDTFLLNREGLEVKEARLGAKETMVVTSDQGPHGKFTKTRAVPATLRDEPALSDALLSELAALGVRVQAHFDGVPQDIEWAVSEGRIWFLQARPITNLPPAPLRDVSWAPPVPGTVWMRRQIVEHMPEPLSPLFAELYLEEGLTQAVEQIGNFMISSADLETMLREMLPYEFATTVNGYAYTIGSFDSRPRHIPLMVRIYTTAVPRLMRQGPVYWHDHGVPKYTSTIERWQAVVPGEAGDDTLLRGMRELAAADAGYWFAASIPLALARISDSMLDGFLKVTADGTASDSEATSRMSSAPFLRGFPSKAMDAQAQLEDIAAQIRDSNALRDLLQRAPAKRLLDTLSAHPEGQAVLGALRDYLETYGHQIYNLDFAVPTQADDPLPVLLGLKTAVEQPGSDTRARQREMAREREVLARETERSLNPLLRPIFRRLLRWAQKNAPYRDEALFYVGAAWPTLRRLALELGRRLADSGSLQTPDDVFFLRTPELETAMAARADGAGRPGLAQLAQERRALREARKRLDPPLAVPPDGTLQIGPFRLKMFEPQPEDARADGPILSGFAVSPGRVTAEASVIRSPEEFDQMQPDTILVCPTTTPAWTPLFSQAKGLVTDIGGALAHGSIVAREYGIPAVMGTGNATARIQSGQRIEIDGDSGTVTLLDEVQEGAPAQATEDESRGPSKALVAVAVGAVVAVVVWWRRRRRSS